MAKYETWLRRDERQLQLMRVVSLFDGPASFDAIDALLQTEGIEGITSALTGFRIRSPELTQAVYQLRKQYLLLPGTLDDTSLDDTSLDAHLMVRDYFRGRLRATDRICWERAHSALRGYFSSRCPTAATSPVGAADVYMAIRHGCLAGEHTKVYQEEYLGKIHSPHGISVVRRHGLFAADLFALYSFFDDDFSRVSTQLPPDARRFVAEQAATRMRWVGRVADSSELMRQLYEEATAERSAAHIAVPAKYLAETLILQGDAVSATSYAVRSINLIDMDVRRVERVSLRALAALGYSEQSDLELARQFARDARAVAHGAGLTIGSFATYLLNTAELQIGEIGTALANGLTALSRLDASLDSSGGIGKVDIALAHLMIGRALHAQSIASDSELGTAANHLAKAVDAAKDSGRFEYWLQALLAQAWLFIEPGSRDWETDSLVRSNIDTVRFEAAHSDLFRLVAEADLLEAFLLADAEPSAAGPKASAAMELLHRYGSYRLDKDFLRLRKIYHI
jgi:hypothetical protein